MARTTPVVQAETVTWSVDRHEHQLTVDTPAWYDWLEEVSTFAFVSDRGTFTARKELRQHGGAYWKAYRKREGKLHRAYLGKSHDMTLQRLNAVAAQLSGQGDTPDRWASGNEMLQTHQASITSLPTNVIVTQQLAPLKSPPKHNLPLQLTSFVGREQDVAAAVKLLRCPEVRLLTLTGPAGVGKTRLALQVATDLLESAPDGVYFVNLAPLRDPDLVLPTVAQTLALREVEGQPLLALLRASLQDKQLLLVLDNFEQVVTAAPSLVDLLETCTALKILVTSREALRLRAEHQFPVPPLALPDLTCLPEHTALVQYPAVSLFLHRAQAARPDFQLTPENAAAIAELCIHLDGLPLAIELAAARVKWLAPQELLARLDHRLQLLTGGARDLPERQQTLQNTITWSYDLLSTEEQQLFRRLAVFAGGCQLAAAEAVSRTLDDGTLPIWQVVSSLIDKSLLQVTEQAGEGPRLIMLETLQEYGLECLAMHGEEEATRRAHAEYYLRLAEEAEPKLLGAQEAMWLERLEREHDNLRAALHWSLEQRKAGHSMELALRLGGALEPLWILHGYYNEGRTFLEHALVASQSVMVSIRAKALRTAAYLALNQDDLQRAATFCEESLALSRELGDTAGITDALEIRGHLARIQNDFVAARSLIEEVVSLARETGDKWRFASGLHDLAWVCLEQGEYSRARSMYEECLTAFRELGITSGIAASLNQLALVLIVSLDDQERVGLLLEESLVLWKQISQKNGGIACWFYLAGRVALSERDFVRARALLEVSVAIYKEMGDQWHTARSLCALARVEAVQSNYVAAVTLYKESLALYRQMGNNNIASVLEGLADVAVRQEQPALAAQLWGAAEALRESMGIPIWPVERADYERSITAARRSLGEKSFADAWTQGHITSLEQALVALGRETIKTPPATQSPTSPTKSTPSSPYGLTAREVEVLRLLAQGLTSAQIAEQLVISLLTVNTHVRSIYSKLGVNSRSAATRCAVEHQLM